MTSRKNTLPLRTANIILSCLQHGRDPSYSLSYRGLRNSGILRSHFRRPWYLACWSYHATRVGRCSLCSHTALGTWLMYETRRLGQAIHAVVRNILNTFDRHAYV